MIYSNGTAAENNVYNDEDQDDLLRAEEQFAEDMQAGLSDDAPWKRIQQNTFTRWANEHLKVVNRQINDLQYDLSDGLLLIALIEILSQKKLPKHNKKTTFRSQKLENVSVALDFLENVEQIKLVNIDASHIVDGRLKLILGLIWTLILHYYISLPRWESMPVEEQKPGREPTPKQKLMGWVKNMLPPDLPITNFTTDWNDGRAIGALVDACAPGLYPDWVDNDPKDALKNTREAMDLAKDWLGIPQLIRPEEMIDPNVDDRSMMTYLSQYPSAKLKPGAPLRPKTNAALARCYGKGIEPVGNFAGEPTEFFVETKQAGVGKLNVILLNPRGQQEKCDIAFQNDPNRTYKCSYTASTEGQYKVIVKYANEEIPGSPFSPFMDRHPANANACRAYGPGLESEITIDKPTWFEVDHSQAGKGRVESVILDPDNQEVPVVIKPVDDGKSRGEYVPRTPGHHAVNILYDGQPIPGSPFSTEAVPDPNACRAYGRGVEPAGVNVGESADFKVVTTDKGDGVVRVAVVGPDGYEVPCNILRTSPQSYDCRYVPRQAGPHHVNVTYDGKHIPMSPFNVMVPQSRNVEVKAHGPGLKGGVVGQPAEFVVETTGNPEDLSFSVEGPDKVKLTCEDRGNGAVGVCYFPTTPGQHAVHVVNNGEEIPGSPFMAWVEPKGAAHASKVQPVKPSDSSRVLVYGPGVEPGVKVNAPTYFIVDCKEAGPGDVSVALTDPLGRDLPLHIEDLDGAFSVGYTPNTAGPHTVTVLFGNNEIAGSPIKVDVEPDVDVSKIYPEEFNSNPVVNRPNQIKMNTLRAGPVNPDLVSAKIAPAFPTSPLPISAEVVPTDTGFGVNYQVPKPGPYTISPVVHGVPLDTLNVEAVEPVDPSKVRVYGPGLAKGTVNQPSDFTIDMSGAGPGELRVAVEGPAKPQLTREDNNDESCRVTYVPTAPGDHLISVFFDDQHVPGSPFRPMISPTKDVRQVRAYGPGIDSSRSVNVGCQTEFTVDARPLSSAGGKDVQCTVHPLQGHPHKASVVDNRNGTYTVKYTPEKKGPLDVDVRYEGTPVPGSPFHMTATDAEPGRIRCYGPGLESAITNQPAQFTIDTTDAGPGHLDVAIDGPGDAPLVMKQKVDGLCVIEYVPTRPGQYEISIMFNGKPIPTCPYVVSVTDRPVDGRQVRVLMPDLPLRVNVPSEFLIDAQGAAPGVPSVNVIDPYGISRPIPVRTVGTETPSSRRGSLTSQSPVPRARYAAELTPTTPGVHQVNVDWSGRPVPGSPFNVQALPRFEPDKVFVSGPGIRPTVPASLPTQFTVDTKSAGNGQLDVLIQTPDNSYLDRSIDDNKDGTYTIHYLPVEPGSYNISVSYDSLPIMNSPFTISVIPTGDPTKCRISGNGIMAQVPVGEQCIIHVDATEAGPGAVTATIVNQAGIPIDFDIIDTKIGTFDIVYVPPTPGQYTIKIRFGGQDIPNGTFVVRASDEPFRHDGGGGQPQLMTTSQSKPLDFRLPVGGAIGDVTAVMRTPSGKRTTPLIEDNRDGTVSIKYHPTEVGEHELSVFYQGVPVQGSPYKFTVDRVTDGYVTAYGPGLSFGVSGEPCHFKVVTKDAGAGSLAVAVEGPSKAEIRCKDNKDGTCDATYWPTAPGDYVITIKYGGKHIAGSPFHAKIVDQPLDEVHHQAGKLGDSRADKHYDTQEIPIHSDGYILPGDNYYLKQKSVDQEPTSEIANNYINQPYLQQESETDIYSVQSRQDFEKGSEVTIREGTPISIVHRPTDAYNGFSPIEPSTHISTDSRTPGEFPVGQHGLFPDRGDTAGLDKKQPLFETHPRDDRNLSKQPYETHFTEDFPHSLDRPQNENLQGSPHGTFYADNFSPKEFGDLRRDSPMSSIKSRRHRPVQVAPDESDDHDKVLDGDRASFFGPLDTDKTSDVLPFKEVANAIPKVGHYGPEPYKHALPVDTTAQNHGDLFDSSAPEEIKVQNFNPIKKLQTADDVPINGALSHYADASSEPSGISRPYRFQSPTEGTQATGFLGGPEHGTYSPSLQELNEMSIAPTVRPDDRDGRHHKTVDRDGRPVTDKLPVYIKRDVEKQHPESANAYRSPDGSSLQPNNVVDDHLRPITTVNAQTKDLDRHPKSYTSDERPAISSPTSDATKSGPDAPSDLSLPAKTVHRKSPIYRQNRSPVFDSGIRKQDIAPSEVDHKVFARTSTEVSDVLENVHISRRPGADIMHTSGAPVENSISQAGPTETNVDGFHRDGPQNELFPLEQFPRDAAYPTKTRKQHGPGIPSEDFNEAASLPQDDMSSEYIPSYSVPTRRIVSKPGAHGGSVPTKDGTQVTCEPTRYYTESPTPGTKTTIPTIKSPDVNVPESGYGSGFYPDRPSVMRDGQNVPLTTGYGDKPVSSEKDRVKYIQKPEDSPKSHIGTFSKPEDSSTGYPVKSLEKSSTPHPELFDADALSDTILPHSHIPSKSSRPFVGTKGPSIGEQEISSPQHSFRKYGAPGTHHLPEVDTTAPGHQIYSDKPWQDDIPGYSEVPGSHHADDSTQRKGIPVQVTHSPSMFGSGLPHEDSIAKAANVPNRGLSERLGAISPNSLKAQPSGVLGSNIPIHVARTNVISPLADDASAKRIPTSGDVKYDHLTDKRLAEPVWSGHGMPPGINISQIPRTRSPGSIDSDTFPLYTSEQHKTRTDHDGEPQFAGGVKTRSPQFGIRSPQEELLRHPDWKDIPEDIRKSNLPALSAHGRRSSDVGTIPSDASARRPYVQGYPKGDKSDVPFTHPKDDTSASDVPFTQYMTTSGSPDEKDASDVPFTQYMTTSGSPDEKDEKSYRHFPSAAVHHPDVSTEITGRRAVPPRRADGIQASDDLPREIVPITGTHRIPKMPHPESKLTPTSVDDRKTAELGKTQLPARSIQRMDAGDNRPERGDFRGMLLPTDSSYEDSKERRGTPLSNAFSKHESDDAQSLPFRTSTTEAAPFESRYPKDLAADDRKIPGTTLPDETTKNVFTDRVPGQATPTDSSFKKGHPPYQSGGYSSFPKSNLETSIPSDSAAPFGRDTKEGLSRPEVPSDFRRPEAMTDQTPGARKTEPKAVHPFQGDANIHPYRHDDYYDVPTLKPGERQPQSSTYDDNLPTAKHGEVKELGHEGDIPRISSKGQYPVQRLHSDDRAPLPKKQVAQPILDSSIETAPRREQHLLRDVVPHPNDLECKMQTSCRQSTVDSRTIITKNTVFSENLCDTDKVKWLDTQPVAAAIQDGSGQMPNLPSAYSKLHSTLPGQSADFYTPELSVHSKPGEPLRRISLSFHLPGLPDNQEEDDKNKDNLHPGQEIDETRGDSLGGDFGPRVGHSPSRISRTSSDSVFKEPLKHHLPATTVHQLSSPKDVDVPSSYKTDSTLRPDDGTDKDKSSLSTSAVTRDFEPSRREGPSTDDTACQPYTKHSHMPDSVSHSLSTTYKRTDSFTTRSVSSSRPMFDGDQSPEQAKGSRFPDEDIGVVGGLPTTSTKPSDTHWAMPVDVAEDGLQHEKPRRPDDTKYDQLCQPGFSQPTHTYGSPSSPTKGHHRPTEHLMKTICQANPIIPLKQPDHLSTTPTDRTFDDKIVRSPHKIPMVDQSEFTTTTTTTSTHYHTESVYENSSMSLLEKCQQSGISDSVQSGLQDDFLKSPSLKYSTDSLAGRSDEGPRPLGHLKYRYKRPLDDDAILTGSRGAVSPKPLLEAKYPMRGQSPCSVLKDKQESVSGPRHQLTDDASQTSKLHRQDEMRPSTPDSSKQLLPVSHDWAVSPVKDQKDTKEEFEPNFKLADQFAFSSSNTYDNINVNQSTFNGSRRRSLTRIVRKSYEEFEASEHLFEKFSFEEQHTSSPSTTGVVRAPYSPDTVGRREIADASRVRVYGAGLDEGYINVANEFVVDSRDAGNGPLAIAIEGPSKANIECPNKDDGTCVVSYKVSEPGTYYVSVKFAEVHVQGSPFTVKVHGPGEPLFRSSPQSAAAYGSSDYVCSRPRVVSDKVSQSVQMQNVSASASRVGSPCELCLRLPGVSPGELNAFVTSPRGRVEDCEVIDVGNQCKSIRFTPKETGIHSVSVKRNGQHIAGSPYQFTVGPIAEGGAQKVHLSGRGLSSGIANVPCEFNVYTREAGSGCLTIQVEGPVNAEINFQEVQDGNGVVSYTCPEPGDYSLAVKFNDQHVPGSPFLVHIEPSASDSRRITIEDIHMPRAKQSHEVNVPLSFNVSTRQSVGTPVKIEAHVISPSGKEEPCTVHQSKEGDKDRYDIRFVPHESGVHRVHVKCNGRELADSPYEFVVGGRSQLDSRKVVASGRGLHSGVVGQPCEFFVDTSQSGTGLLAVVVDGPSKVQLDCKECAGGYNVSFIATAPGDYTISIKFAGNTIAGSPYKCHITDSTDRPSSSMEKLGGSLADRYQTSERTTEMYKQQSSRLTNKSQFYSQEISSHTAGSHGRYSTASAGWAIADGGMKTGTDLYSEPQKVRTYGTGITRAKRDEQTEFTVDATEAGHNMLMVGILGPSRPCEEVLVKHVGKNIYNVSYIVREKGSYVLIVKWGDSHIPGSPFYIEVP